MACLLLVINNREKVSLSLDCLLGNEIYVIYECVKLKSSACIWVEHFITLLMFMYNDELSPISVIPAQAGVNAILNM